MAFKRYLLPPFSQSPLYSFPIFQMKKLRHRGVRHLPKWVRKGQNGIELAAYLQRPPVLNLIAQQTGEGEGGGGGGSEARAKVTEIVQHQGGGGQAGLGPGRGPSPLRG